jgi:hypothetical protein
MAAFILQSEDRGILAPFEAHIVEAHSALVKDKAPEPERKANANRTRGW